MVNVSPPNQDAISGRPWRPSFGEEKTPQVGAGASDLSFALNGLGQDEKSQDRDRAKRVLKASLRLGVTTDLVDANLEEAESRIQAGDFDVETFRKNSPILARWLAGSPHHIALTRPDKENLSDLEKLYARKDDPLRRLTETEIQGLTDILTEFELGKRRRRVGIVEGGLSELPLRSPIEEMRRVDPANVRAEMLDKLRNYEEFVAGTGKIGAFGAPVGPAKIASFTDIPGFGEIVEAGEIGRIFIAAQNVETDSATKEEKALLLLYGRLWTTAGTRGKTFWAKVGEGIVALPNFAIQFAGTGGAFRGAKEGVEALIKRSFRKVLGESTRKFLGIGVGVVAGGIAQTGAQAPLFLVSDTLERMTPGITVAPGEEGQLRAVLTDEADDFLPGLLKASGARAIENLSERSGRLVNLLGNKVGIQSVKAAIAKRWFAKAQGRGAAEFLKEVASKTGWNGIIGEVFEERVSELGRAVTGIDPLPDFNLEDLAAEAVTFAIPTGGALSIRGAEMVVEAKSNRDNLKAIQAVLRRMQTTKESPEVIEDFLDRVVKGGPNGFVFVPIESWEDIWSKIKDEGGNPVNPRAMARSLGVTAETYDEAIDTKGRLQVSMPAFAIRVLMKPEGDSFLDSATTDPLAPTIADAQLEEVTPEELPATPGVTAEAAGIPNPTEEETAQLQELERVADKALDETGAPDVLNSLFPEKQQEAVTASVAESRRKLVERLAETIRRKRGTEFKKQRKVIREGVETEVNQQQEYIVLSVLRTGRLPSGESSGLEGLKLSRQAIKDEFGLKAADLPRGILAKEGEEGFHPDEAAELLGYPLPIGAGKMLRDIINAEFVLPREVLIERRTDALMSDRLQAIQADPAKLREEALAALHTKSRSSVLEADLKQLVTENPALFRRLIRRVAGPLPTVKEMRRFAEERIRGKTLSELSVGKYQAAARKAHREAAKAFGKQNVGEAFDHKLTELRAVEFARAAQRAREKARKVPRNARKFAKRQRQERLGKAGALHRNAMNEILDRFEFFPGEALTPRDTGIKEWRDAQILMGVPPFIDQILLIEGYRKPWDELPIGTLLSIGDSMKNIWHVARSERSLLTAARKETFDETVRVGLESMEQNRIGAPKEVTIGELTKGQRIYRSVARGVAHLRKFTNILQELDGFKNGFMWNLLGLPLNQRQEQELDRSLQSDKVLSDLLSVYTRRERRRSMHRKQYIPDLLVSLSKWDIISAVLNMGNVDNLTALRKGYGWTESQIEVLKTKLDERDTTFIQGVWDHIDTFWAETKALSEKVDGIPVRKVQAVPFTIETSDGKTVQMRGGYYPLDYIPDATIPHKSIDQLTQDSLQGKAFRASTQHQHRNNRVGSGGQRIRLSMGLIKSHLRDVIHDQTHYEWVVDANRLLRNKELSDGIKSSIGDVGYQELIDTVNAVALNNRQHLRGLDVAFEWMARRTRGAVLVGNVSTVFKQYLGLAATARTIGAKWTMRGLTAAGIGGAQTREVEEWIRSLSVFMKTRRGFQDRDAAEALNSDPGLFEGSVVGDAVRGFENWGWGLIASAQWHVDRATWLGAYHKFAEELGLENASSREQRKSIEENIVGQADQAVRDSQGSALLADLPAIMRSRGTARLFTIFQTFMVNQLSLFAKTALPAAKRPSLKTISQAATTFIALYIIPQLLWDEAWGALRGDEDEEPEPLPSKIGRTAIKEFMGSVPIAREVAPAVDRLFGVGSRDYRGPAGLTFLAESVNLAGQIEQAIETGEIDKGLIRSTIRMSGIAIPGTVQLDRIVSGYISWDEEEGGPTSLIFGPPRRR